MKKRILFLWLLAFGAQGLQTAVKAEVVDTMRMYDLQEVEIKASRMNSALKNLPQKVEVVTSEQLQSLPSENLAEVLKRVVNLDIVQYPGVAATTGMRGFSPSAHSRSYTLILIDGAPSGTNNLASILTSNIERVEIIKGPYATLYGSDAMGGVINIITRQLGKPLQGNILIEAGNPGYYKAEAFAGGAILPGLKAGLGLSLQKQGDNYLIGKNNLFKMSELEKLILDKQSYGDTMRHSTYDLNHLDGQLDWQINPRWRAKAGAVYTWAKEVQLHGNYWGSYGQSKKEVDRRNFHGTIERKTNSAFTSLNPYYSQEKDPNYSDNTSEGFINFESDIKEYGFQLQHQQNLGDFKLLGGIDYRVNDYHSERFEAKGTPTAPYKPDNRFGNSALFVQGSYSSDRFDANLGARYDHFRYHVAANEALHAPEANNTYNTFNPSLGAQYRFSEKVKAHTSFGTAFSVPDAYKTAGKYDVSVYFAEWDFWWTQSYVGNPALKPEKSRSADIGLKYSDLTRGFDFDATYFYNFHHNMITETTLGTGEKSYLNADKATMDGLEIDTRFNFGALFHNKFILELYANCTWLFHSGYTRTLSGTNGIDSLITKDLEFVRKANGNFGLYFQNDKGISARLNARYIGSRFEKDSFGPLRPGISSSDYTTEGGYTVADQVLKHPDYLIFDLSLRYAFKNKIEIGCLLSNLFDENYSEKDGFNLYGRQVKLSIGYRFKLWTIDN